MVSLFSDIRLPFLFSSIPDLVLCNYCYVPITELYEFGGIVLVFVSFLFCVLSL